VPYRVRPVGRRGDAARFDLFTQHHTEVMSNYTTRERMNMSHEEWERKVCGIEHEDVLLIGGPLDGGKITVSVEAEGPFRRDVAGRGVAQYQRTHHRGDGTARAEFIGFEETYDHSNPAVSISKS